MSFCPETGRPSIECRCWTCQDHDAPPTLPSIPVAQPAPAAGEPCWSGYTHGIPCRDWTRCKRPYHVDPNPRRTP